MDYRIAGRVIIPEDRGKKILLVEQVPEENFWIIPGGGVEEGETSTQAAIRELSEETGLEVELVRFLWCSEDYSPKSNQLSMDLIYLGLESVVSLDRASTGRASSIYRHLHKKPDIHVENSGSCWRHISQIPIRWGLLY
ncbi:NUDIX domain-containing protein [Candidatus Poribacteria bacterium]|nr:NUDIX domain-containing protein [Candidatus Poribacteria bacterium]